MKRLKNILPALFVAFVAAVSLTSCLGDDGFSNGISPELEMKYRMTMSGNYRGKVFFKNNEITDSNNKSKIDSLLYKEADFKYADSTVVLQSIPAKLFFKAIDYDNLKEAAEAYGDVDVRLKYEIYGGEDGATDYLLSVKPITLTLEYDGAKHDLLIAFMTNTRGYYRNNKMFFQFIEAAIYDGKDEKGKWKLLEDGGELYKQGLENTDPDKFKNLIFEFSGSRI